MMKPDSSLAISRLWLAALFATSLVTPLACTSPPHVESSTTESESELSTPPFPAEQLASPERHEFGVTVTPDRREYFFGVDFDRRPEIWTTRYDGDAWTEPEPLLRDDRYKYFDPFMTTDGVWLHFVSDQPHSGRDVSRTDADLWRMKRHEDGSWAEPEALPPPVNSAFDEYYTSIDASGRLAFSSNRNTDQPGQTDYDLYLTDGVPSAQVGITSFGSPVNNGAFDADPLIAPDGSYVVFASSRRGGHGRWDLYVSFRDGDGWQRPINLGPEINTEHMELCPALDSAGNWLLFTTNQDIRRAPISVLQAARAQFRQTP